MKTREPLHGLLQRAALASCLLAFSCAGAKPPFQFRGPPPESAADRAMAQLSESLIDDVLRIDPVHASYVGYHRYDGLLPDLSPAGIARASATLARYERELDRLAATKLSTPYAIDRELALDQLRAQRFQLEELKAHTFDVQIYNEAIGSGIYDLTVPPEDPAKTPERLAALLDRLAAIPGFLEQAKKNLVAPPRAFTEFVIAQNPGNIDTIEKDLPKLFTPYPKLAARFEVERPKATKALREWQSWLEKELLVRSTGDWRLGKERFAKKLAHTLGSSLSPEEIYGRAERGLEATRFEMYDLALPLFQATWPEDKAYLELVGDERINYVVGKVLAKAADEHGTPASIFTDVKAYAEKVKAFLRASKLIDLPPESDRFVIEPTPPYLDGLATAFFNPAPAFEPDLKKSFWISSVPKAGTADGESYLREYNSYTLQALTIHEAFPGHYVQLYTSSHSPNASILKQVFESGTMTEGWAVMIEQLVHEAGYSKGDPKNHLFHLKMRLRVFINAMIDRRLHESTGDPKEVEAWALELLTKKGFQEEAEATRKLRRAKLTSTQLSTYFVGYTEMLDIYRAAEKKARPGELDRRATLQKMLSFGSIPPRMIRRLLEADGTL